MATYLILNAIFIGVMLIAARYMGLKPTLRLMIAGGILLILTAVFDNLAIASDLFGYSTDRLLGLYLILAPVEDFAYTIGAIIIVPAVWSALNERKN